MNTCCTPPAPGATLPAQVPTGVKPRYSVDGDKTSYAIRVELPGVKKENVRIDLDGEILTIHAKRTSPAGPEWNALHREILEDDFVLRLKLNTPVDETRLAARLEHGVLTLELPLQEAAKPRTIPVN